MVYISPPDICLFKALVETPEYCVKSVQSVAFRCKQIFLKNQNNSQKRFAVVNAKKIDLRSYLYCQF